MTLSAVPLPLPPGTAGLPLVGETLRFLPDIFGFLEQRLHEHGPICRTNLLGKDVALLAGPEATALFYDPLLVQREGSFPGNVLQLFGGSTARILPVLDGPEHQLRKRLTLQAFDHQAIASYLPVLQAAVDRAFDRWVGRGEFGWQEELKQLAVEGVAACLLGLGPGPEVDRLAADYRIVTAGFAGLPIPLPGTAFSAGLKARDRILSYYAEVTRERAARPTQDGLSRLLAARGPAGEALEHGALALELHHVFLAGYIIFAAMEAIALALQWQPGLRARLAAELRAVVPSGPLDPQLLRKLPLLLATAMEAKRVPAIVPITFGRARRSFDFAGYRVPEGWLVFLAVTENNHDRGSFREPLAFDIDRFSEGRKEQDRPFAYVPQGAGPADGHKCLGADFSTVFLQTFTARLVRDHTHRIVEQDLSLRRDVVPPEYKSGLRAQVQR